jgi:glycosyltransferase involved in cell wall biosynthesis
MLSLAAALSQWADVTLAFRTIHEPIAPGKVKVIAIEPQTAPAAMAHDDVALRGLNPLPHLSYLQRLRQFARQWAGTYDVVFEKGWRLSGLLLAAFRRYGIPGVLIENDVRCWNEPRHHPRVLAKYLAHSATQCLAGVYSRRVPLVIAETDELKTVLIEQRGLVPQQVEVVGLGVDHGLFRPLPQAVARARLGISPESTVLLYVGGMDIYHDLTPLLEALAQVRLETVALHLVGDGRQRPVYEVRAQRVSLPVHFHGHVQHAAVPEFIAAADVCLAPYRADAFYNRQVTFSTLKIPEYMACGRPVISIPSGSVQRLIAHGVSGFLFPNDVISWLSFLRTLPDRSRLASMGQQAARSVQSVSWESTATQYLEVSQRLLGSQ